RGGHALMHEARLVADIFGKVGEKGDDVMLGLAFDLFDPVDIEIAALPHRFCGGFGDDTELRLSIAGMRLDLEPDTEFALRLPDRSHFGAGITGNHGGYNFLTSKNGRRLT